MKFKFNRKYSTIAGYVFMTFVACLLVLVLVFKISIIQVYINKFISVTAPIIWGIAIAYLLNPVLRFIEKYVSKILNRKKQRKKLTRMISVFFTLLILFALIIILIANIVPEILSSINNIFNNAQGYFDNIQSTLEEGLKKFNNDNPDIKDFIASEIDDIESVVMQVINSLKPQFEKLFVKNGILDNLTDSAISLLFGIKDFLIGVIVAAYLMFSKEWFVAHGKRMICALFNRKHSMKILHICGLANDKFVSFLSGKALDSVIIGMICFVAMTILKLPYTVLISVIVGVTNMIPFFGPFIGAIPSAALILLTEPKKTLIFVIMILVLQQLDGNVIGPKILGKQLGLNAFWILFSIIIGGGFFGFVGMVLAVPCFAVIYPLVKEFLENRLRKKDLSTDVSDYYADAEVLSKNLVTVSERAKRENNGSEDETDDTAQENDKNAVPDDGKADRQE